MLVLRSSNDDIAGPDWIREGVLSAKILEDLSCAGPEVLLWSSSGPLIDDIAYFIWNISQIYS